MTDERRHTLDEKFDTSYTRDSDGCWLWTGSTTGDGYGVLRGRRAHRYSYQRYKGPIPPDHEVRHQCHVKRCVNPDHLLTGTPQQNAMDDVVAGKRKSRLSPEEVERIRNGIKPEPMFRVPEGYRPTLHPVASVGIPVPGRPGEWTWVLLD
jgi:HNH endonuclease